MTASIQLSDGDRLEIDAYREAVRMTPAIAGARIELGLTVARVPVPPIANPSPNVVPAAEQRHRVTAALYVSTRLPQQDRRYLCQLEAEHLVTAVERSTKFRVYGFIPEQQLRVLEELRAGKGLWLILALTVSLVEGKLARLAEADGELSFSVGAGEWSEQMEQVDAGTFVEVLVPMAGGEDYAGAVALLREARTLLRDNKVDAALLAARKALEVVRASFGTEAVYKEAVKQRPAQRDLRARWAVMVEDLFSTLSGALHNDEVTKDFVYSREDGATLIAGTAGMLGRLAKERHLL
ncbi:hypothetical protein DDE19_25865 [Micromonospora ureilytica]|uniref:Uncharacterized protein n=1 Tax=Micromonospora ureilytica TaxID=709868 RepID=A0A3N9XK67_9ACTN|nr:hypothetical protein [Micromonospora ureilytica]RQX13370.1 hypothetical protein DDE19_25865 [Micromonospora ureilytica]